MQKLYHRAVTKSPEVMEALDLCSVPASVKEAEHLMQEDLKLKEGPCVVAALWQCFLLVR